LHSPKKKAVEMGVQVDYRQGDIRQISLKDEFDRVLLLFTSFGYFTDDENEQLLKNMASALKPGGTLMFDIPNRDTILKDLSPSDVIEKEGGLLINRFSFDVLTGRFHNRRIVIRNGIRKDKPFYIRLYNATEICNLLGEADLVDYKLFGEDDQPVSSRSWRIVVIAKKPVRI
jgi:SAM-dependent methyltransferase